METQKKLISIVLLNWNGKKLMQKFLPTLIKNSKGIDIYVVDNNSNDDSVKYLQENFKHVKIIQHKQNLGYAKGYNDAIKNIKTKYLVLINSDIETTKLALIVDSQIC